MPIQIGVLKRSAPTMRVLRRANGLARALPDAICSKPQRRCGADDPGDCIREGKDRFDLGHMGVKDEQTVLRSNRSHTRRMHVEYLAKRNVEFFAGVARQASAPPGNMPIGSDKNRPGVIGTG